MELEGSVPHSEVPTTCPYPEPAQSSLYHLPPIPLLDGPSYHPLIYAWVFQMLSFFQVSPPYIHISYTPIVLHAPPISFFSI